MGKLFDFKCGDCEYVWEDVGMNEDDVKLCPKCQQPSYTIISACNFKLDGTDPAFATAYDQWEKRRYRQIKQENKRRG